MPGVNTDKVSGLILAFPTQSSISTVVLRQTALLFPTVLTESLNANIVSLQVDH